MERINLNMLSPSPELDRLVHEALGGNLEEDDGWIDTEGNPWECCPTYSVGHDAAWGIPAWLASEGFEPYIIFLGAASVWSVTVGKYYRTTVVAPTWPLALSFAVLAATSKVTQ